MGIHEGAKKILATSNFSGPSFIGNVARTRTKFGNCPLYLHTVLSLITCH